MVVDTSIWLEIFLDGKLKDPCLKLVDDQSIVPILVYYEAYKKLKLQFSEAKALEAMGSLSRYDRVDVTTEIALLAGDLAIEFRLGLAGSIVLATARHSKMTLLTLDNDFAGIPGVRVLQAV